MNFKLKAEGKAESHLLKGLSPSLSYQDLKKEIQKTLSLPTDSFEVLAGYPPALLTPGESQEIQTVLKNNDLIVVKSGDLPKSGPTKSTTPKKKATTKATVKKAPLTGVHSLVDFQSPPKGQRAPRMEMDDDDEPDYVPENAYQPTGEQRKSGRKTKMPTPSQVPTELAPAPKRKKTEGGQAKANKGATKRKLPTDGAPAPKKIKKAETPKAPEPAPGTEDINFDYVGEILEKQKDPLDFASSKDALAEVLALTAQGEELGGKNLKLKEAFKTGLQIEQEQTLGISRYKAALEKTFKATVASVNRVSNTGSFIKITFLHSGEEVSEVYEFYSKPHLKAILTFIVLTQGQPGKEGMRPLKMATISPRTFWSMIHNFGDVETGLKTLLPSVDWSFLRYRVRAQSASAKEAGANQKVMDLIDQQYKREKWLKNQSNETQTTMEEVEIDSKSEEEGGSSDPIVLDEQQQDRGTEAPGEITMTEDVTMGNVDEKSDL